MYINCLVGVCMVSVYFLKTKSLVDVVRSVVYSQCIKCVHESFEAKVSLRKVSDGY